MAYLGRSLAGDFASLYALTNRLSNEEVASLLLEMYRVKASQVAFRYLLRDFWIRRHDLVIAVAGGIPTVCEMFRYAAFPVSASIGLTVKAYRGTRGIPAGQSAATGMCWSLNRDIACYHAFPDGRGGAVEPVVIEAEIPREHILMYTEGKLLSEITIVPISTNPKIEYRVSLPVEDWLVSRTRFVAERTASLALMKQNPNELSPSERANREVALAELVGPLTNRG
ncbi:hypothetical protein M3A49_02340 [Paraburkholderia sp. CNPSo 3076]|uniref:hypothetical protein n=1 Tax=Paraburkholderia sp. CNPSo 3076 TaxID=2940936 RepID=UPI0022528399|nr:hypothetical protein [Paraburkholderia sp. CNPSo 3076]MCX5538348.1 hypothetical protein [Paraburkholderia sp. CNPSo 3076]